MSHVNTQLRAEVASRLTDLGIFGSVSTNRSNDLDLVDLPAAVITTPRDAVQKETKDVEEQRVVELVIVIVIDGEVTELDDALDAFRVQVEQELGDGDLGGLAFELAHTGGEIDIAREEDGDRWFAFLTLEWEVVIWTARGDPETAL